MTGRILRAAGAETGKLLTTAGAWVVLGLDLFFVILADLDQFVHKGTGNLTVVAPTTLHEIRIVLIMGLPVGLALLPLFGILCVTSDFRHRTLSSALLQTPRRLELLAAKGIATSVCAIVTMALGLLVGLLYGFAGDSGTFFGQVPSVALGLFLDALLIGLFGLAIGTLGKNQLAAVFVGLGTTVIIGPVVQAFASHFFLVDLNWLPNTAFESVIPALVTGTSPSGPLLVWWTGALAGLAWGVGTLTLGWLTNFRKDVT